MRYTPLRKEGIGEVVLTGLQQGYRGFKVASFGIPEGPEELTACWLTRVLRSTGIIGSAATIDRLDWQLLGGNQGFAGRLVRVCVDYESSCGDAPHTLIAKLHSHIDTTRQILQDLKAPEREVRFYREVAGQLAIHTPALYYGDFDASNGKFVLLLEDLAPWCAGDLVAGCSTEQIDDAIGCAAVLHASWWCSSGFGSMEWIPSFDRLTAARHAMSQERWDLFMKKYRGRIPSRFVAVSDQLRQSLGHVRGRLSQVPPTLLHGDYRPDNILFGTDRCAPLLSAIDWQVCMRGPGVCDVAYFLVACGPVELRREIERTALQTYHRELLQQGVHSYPFEQCLVDYRLAIVDIVARVVVLTMGLAAGDARGQIIFDVLAERACMAALDLDCISLLAPGSIEEGWLPG